MTGKATANVVDLEPLAHVKVMEAPYVLAEEDVAVVPLAVRVWEAMRQVTLYT